MYMQCAAVKTVVCVINDPVQKVLSLTGGRLSAGHLEFETVNATYNTRQFSLCLVQLRYVKSRGPKAATVCSSHYSTKLQNDNNIQ